MRPIYLAFVIMICGCSSDDDYKLMVYDVDKKDILQYRDIEGDRCVIVVSERVSNHLDSVQFSKRHRGLYLTIDKDMYIGIVVHRAFDNHAIIVVQKMPYMVAMNFP